jgi:glycosyltransferase involved in cell wall biosynthesis
MHIICVNYFYDRFLTTPEALLGRYRTLTDWAESLVSAGARVSVVQRFECDGQLERNGVGYRFVCDPALRFGHPADVAQRVNRAVVALQPDVVHANGMPFSRQAARLKRLLPQVPILIQDHAGAPPVRRFSRWTLRRALRHIDAVSFTVAEQTTPWCAARILGETPLLLELPESSSRFQMRPQADARWQTGLNGDPLCLFVGRLNANKDPLTILAGFGCALDRLPGARLVMVYNATDLLPAVRTWLLSRPEVAQRVTLLGERPHETLEAIYNSADFFLLGSDYDGGSGYSLLEAMSCGVVPLVTDIPSFRAVLRNGEFGGLWPVGDATALAAGLVSWNTRRGPQVRQQLRSYFDAELSFEAIGRAALAAYKRLVEGRN